MPHAEWTLFAQDFRGLRKVNWSPSGVCLLSGPNGAGKSSVLDALEFLRTAVDRGVPEAVRLAGGGALLRRLGAEPKAPVCLGLSIGDLSWGIQLPVEGGSIHANHGEEVKLGGNLVARRAMFAKDFILGKKHTVWHNPTSQTVTVRTQNPNHTLTAYTIPPGESAHIPHEYEPELELQLVKTGELFKDGDRWAADKRSVLQMLSDMFLPSDIPPEVATMIDLVREIRIYRTYRLDQIREPQSGVDVEAHLLPNGRNVWNVLRNWRAAPRKYRDQFRWVVDALREAFPELVLDLEFDTEGQTVVGRFYPPNAPTASDSLPLSLAADGLLVGILHLTAVAGAPEGSILAFDEMENQLHPHAIRAILKAMRQISEERNLTIVLTTHSPIVMNEFKGHEDQFYVLESGHEDLPVPLDKALDPDWLAHFSLGDLYDREDFAAQKARPASPHAAE
jgi:predicted ATPase